MTLQDHHVKDGWTVQAQQAIVNVLQTRAVILGTMIPAFLGLIAVALPLQATHAVVHIGNHAAKFNGDGRLMPWMPVRTAIDLEMGWYEKCPKPGKYHSHVVLTFMDDKYSVAKHRTDAIPAMQSATGILSYLAYDRLANGQKPWVVSRAKEFADYILESASTPAKGEWPSFPRSTGHANTIPQPADCGSQADHAYEVQPDKGAMFAYALVELYQRTHEQKYIDAAVRLATLLEVHMAPGDADHSPWPFRVDYRSGEPRGPISSDMGYPLALFDSLVQVGYQHFAEPKQKVWNWIKTYQLPSAQKDGRLWTQFFEDYALETNKNSWSATNLVKLLLTRKEAIDPDWLKDASSLMDYVNEHFITIRFGVPVCGEQDDDKDPWGGALTNYGAAMAMLAKATGDPATKSLALQAMTFAEYAIDTDGCPGQSALYRSRGGWQEDAHTDVIRNFVDALEALPNWK